VKSTDDDTTEQEFIPAIMPAIIPTTEPENIPATEPAIMPKTKPKKKNIYILPDKEILRNKRLQYFNLPDL
jgi:hypothetical protein